MSYIFVMLYFSKISNFSSFSTLKRDDIVKRKSNICNQFGMKLTNKPRELHLIYWTLNCESLQLVPDSLLNIIFAVLNLSLKEFLKNIYKLIFLTVHSFYEKSRSYSNSNRFWVVEISFL